jgi:hypothetical protein
VWRVGWFIPLRVANTGLVDRDSVAEGFGRQESPTSKSEVGLRSLLKAHAEAKNSLGCSSVAEQPTVNR